jgi:hypothetical protein
VYLLASCVLVVFIDEVVHSGGRHGLARFIWMSRHGVHALSEWSVFVLGPELAAKHGPDLLGNQRPLNSAASVQLSMAPPLVEVQLSDPLPFAPRNAPVPPVTVITFVQVASALLVNWYFPV